MSARLRDLRDEMARVHWANESAIDRWIAALNEELAAPPVRPAMTPEELDALLLERFGLDEADLDFVVWFFGAADFGPADSDVRAHLFDAYEREKGVQLSERIDWRKEDTDGR